PLFFSPPPPPPRSTLFPYTTLFRSWANYFCLGPVSRAYHAVEQHARDRLRQWLRKKHKMPGRATSRFPDEYLHQTLGLIELSKRDRKSTRLNSSHVSISYAVFCLKK